MRKRPLSADAGGRRLVLTGGSMAPTLREGDLLRLAPPGVAAPRAGDVVAFGAGGDAPVIVHRVLRADAAGLLTRGDGARGEDAGRVDPGLVLGRVVAARRGSRDLPVAGGPRGRLVGAAARLRNRTLRAAARLLRPLLPLLPPAGWASALLPASARPKVVRFESPERVERRVLLGGRVAGRYDESAGRWRIRLRYRPFVRTERLPRA